ncbi:MAG: LptE family protein [Bacteroidales bacterium]|nr:LptE family protein [Bacteroidales bacterium]
MKLLKFTQNVNSDPKGFKDKRIWLAKAAMVSVFVFLFSSCGIYSFTGASIPPDAKTISVGYFSNKAPLVDPTLSQTFTNTLRDMFNSQTNLQMVPKNGDLQFSGEITGYSITPQAIQANQTAALNRLSITVKVQYINTKDHTKDFDTSFTEYRDYTSDQNFNTVKDKLVGEICTSLSEDIFNKALVNW